MLGTDNSSLSEKGSVAVRWLHHNENISIPLILLAIYQDDYKVKNQAKKRLATEITKDTEC